MFIKTYHINNKTGLLAHENNGWVFLSIFLLFVFTLLVIFYIMEVNSIVARGYDIKSYNDKLESLKTENERMRLEKSKLSSFESMKSRLVSLDLLESQEISYLDIFGEAVAINQ